MVVEEENLRDKLLANTEKFGSELIKLCRDLHKPPHEVITMTILKLLGWRVIYRSCIFLPPVENYNIFELAHVV